MREVIDMLRNKCRDFLCEHCPATWKFICILRNKYREEELWHNIGLYWKAYEDYRDMCEEADTTPDKAFPYYIVWAHDPRMLFMCLVGAGLAFGVWVLCNLGEPKLLPYAAIVELGVCLGAIYLLFPTHYRSCSRAYNNLVYIHFYTDTMAYRLNKDVVRLTALVEPWREQKAKEAAERKRQAKERYIGMFRALLNYAETQFGIKTPNPERLGDKFTVILPNPENGRDGKNATVTHEFDYSQFGLLALIQEITKAITAQAEQKGQSEISALLEAVAPAENAEPTAD